MHTPQITRGAAAGGQLQRTTALHLLSVSITRETGTLLALFQTGFRRCFIHFGPVHHSLAFIFVTVLHTTGPTKCTIQVRVDLRAIGEACRNTHARREARAFAQKPREPMGSTCGTLRVKA